MTYSLHTLHAKAFEPPPAPTGWARFATEIAIVAGFFALAFALLALTSYSAQDAAWTTSGTGAAPLNHAGRFGALFADLAFFVLGYSVWWLLAVALRAWIALVALRLQSIDIRLLLIQGTPDSIDGLRIQYHLGWDQ